MMSGAPSTDTTQCEESSSQRAPLTTAPNVMCFRRSYLSATWSAYFFSSAPRCEKPGPVRIGLERIRVGDRRDVDSQTGIAVDVPGSTQIVLALEDRQVVQAQPLELNGRTHSAEARPHYYCVVLHCHRRIPLVNCTSEKLHIRN